MAPRRNVKISSPEKRVDTGTEKLPKGRPRKAQPLKVPSLITISIPINKSDLNVPDTEKKVDVTTKRALADEVARAQLLKVPIEARVVIPTPKRARGRKKEVVSEFFNVSAIKTEPVEDIVSTPDIVPITSAVKKNSRKPPVKNSEPSKVVTRKRVADSTVKKPRIKRQRITPKVVATKVEKDSTEETVPDDGTKADSTEQNLTQRVSTRRKVRSKAPKIVSEKEPDVNSNLFSSPTVATPNLRKRLNRGKRTCVANREKILQPVLESSGVASSPASAGQSSKPDDNTNTPTGTDTPKLPLTGIETSNARRIKTSKAQTSSTKSSTKEADNIKGHNPVDSRKNSISSTSNLSWTRDISSSSTTTCFTVASNDFFCFDKKMPILKLVNIDSEIDNYKPKPLEEDSSSSSDDSSSSDSESSSEEGQSENRFGSNSSVKVNPLNLSLSSCTSVVTQSEDRNIDKKDYGKAAENLMQALKKIDMEFINWIHDDDSVTSHLDRIKDRLFDILSNEFYAITHCRNLQEISNTDVSELKITNKPKDLTENQINSNTTARNTKHNKLKKTVECNAFDRIRTRSCINKSKSVESDAVKSNKVGNDLIERNTPESNVDNDLAKTNTLEVNSLRSNTVPSDLIKNKVIDNNPVKSNPIDSNVESYLLKTNRCESIPPNNNNMIENNPPKINIIENTTINPIEMNSVDYNRVDNNAANSKKDDNKPAHITVDTSKVENNIAGSDRVDINLIDTNIVNSHYTKSNRLENQTEEEFIKPSTSGFGSNIFNDRTTRRRSHVSETSESSCNNDTDTELNRLTSPHDDDDALSLFAESITGIESSRLNTSIISAPVENKCEEYIPKPVVKNDFISPKGYTYCPTRISDQVKNESVKTICLKQNADSTSIFKESNSLPTEDKETGSLPDSAESDQEYNDKVVPNHSEANTPNKIILMSNVYQLKPKAGNIIFKGYCYFNLTNRCLAAVYGKECRYSHAIPDDHFVIKKLSSLSNEVLIKEYMLIRKNDYIMRRYGMFVLFECVQRGLTRIVVEIAYDFIKRNALGFHIDATIKIAAVEIALLHLNDVDLSVCEDLLFLEVPGSCALLCEAFMQVMTSTQNFSRFKSVFLSLTYFMVNNDRTFSLEVAEQILERVCILPFEEPVIKSLIQIIRLTKPEIFLNPIIGHFEKLISVSSAILDEYVMIKSGIDFEKLARQVADQRQATAVDKPVTQQPATMLHLPPPLFHQPPPSMHQPPPSMDQPPPLMNQPPHLIPQPSRVLHQPLMPQTVDPALNVRPEIRECVPLPPSPDTTHFDNMNKSAEDIMVPRITRTVQSFNFTPNAHISLSPSSSNSEELLQSRNYNSWRNRSIFQHINRSNYLRSRSMRPPGRMLRPPGRMMRKFYNHRQVTFGGSPTVYTPPGPDM